MKFNLELIRHTVLILAGIGSAIVFLTQAPDQMASRPGSGDLKCKQASVCRGR